MISVSGWAASFVMPLVLAAPAPSPVDFSNPNIQAKLKKAVEGILPDGWTITKTSAGVTPSDWETSTPKAGFLIEAGDSNGATAQVFILPRDWIGIRKLKNQAPRTCYWEGILVGDTYKTITASSDDKIQERVHDLFGRGSMSTPSLVNSGFDQAMEIFKDKCKEADQTAQALIKDHCNTPKEFTEAAHSLIVLGVPAKSVFLRAARDVESDDKDLFCSALGYIGGEEAIGVLCDIVVDERVPDYRRKYAVMALDGHTDKRIGPALVKALKNLRNEEAIEAVARLPIIVRYQPAAPELISALKRMESSYSKADVAQALAALRCKEAVPEIKKLLEDLQKDKQAFEFEGRKVELALLRLTADWGKPSKDVRLLVVAPEKVALGDKIQVRMYEENIGQQILESLYTPQLELEVNGKPLTENKDLFVYDGPGSRTHPGEVKHMSLDLSSYLKKSGTYKLRYVVGDARSAEITIRIVDPK
jgi:hypothetical protein